MRLKVAFFYSFIISPAKLLHFIIIEKYLCKKNEVLVFFLRNINLNGQFIGQNSPFDLLSS